jgi:hypothetical protein
MRSRLSTLLTALVLAMLLLACASHPTKVDCEGKLRPINSPAPAVHSDAIGHEG